jgi:hypothetical protein
MKYVYVIEHKYPLVAALLLLILLMGCSPKKSDSRQATLETNTTIIYEREGGFTGISQEWVIHLDGSIEGPGDQQLMVPAEDVQELVGKGMESNFESMVAETANTETCCDQLTYTLTLVSGDNEWQLITTDTANQPKEVTELFIMVQALVDEAQPVP